MWMQIARFVYLIVGFGNIFLCIAHAQRKQYKQSALDIILAVCMIALHFTL